jgi:glycerophosphoryl diester phosphodiesterase
MRLSVFPVALWLVMLSVMASAQNIVAHRGASHDAPENTLAAFNLAWEQGADGVEGDFYLSSDGQIVCIHDKDTKRTAGVKHAVAKTPYDVLRTLDVGSWKDPKFKDERIPLLSDVLATVPEGKFMIVELKVGPEIVQPTKEALETSSLKPEQILIICFNDDTVAECKKLMPDIRCHWLTGYKENKENKEKDIKPDVEKVLKTLHRTGADGLGSEAKPVHVNAEFLTRLKDGGCREFHVWTINDPELAKFYQPFGPWGITTDRPGWLREQLGIPAASTRLLTGEGEASGT